MRWNVGRTAAVPIIAVLVCGSVCLSKPAAAQEKKITAATCDSLPRGVQRARTMLTRPAYKALNALAWETGDVLESGCVEAEVLDMAWALMRVDATVDRYVRKMRRWSRHPCMNTEALSMHLLAGELLQMVYHECGVDVLKPLCADFPMDPSRLDPGVLWELESTKNGIMGAACSAVR